MLEHVTYIVYAQGEERRHWTGRNARRNAVKQASRIAVDKLPTVVFWSVSGSHHSRMQIWPTASPMQHWNE